MISDEQRRQTAGTAALRDDILWVHQPALRDDILWVHQPAFDKTFADLTGTQPEDDEWRRETQWNFTADEQSFT